MLHRLAILSAGLALICGPVALRAADSGSPVRVTAVVTDGRGQRVTNLKTSDFELREDGGVQTIDAVTDLASETVPARLIAFLLDEYHVSGDASALVRQAVHRFVDEEMHPNDLVVVLKPLDSVLAIRPTRDRSEIHRAIDGFTGRMGDYTAPTAFESTYVGRDPSVIEAARAQMVLSGLNALAQRLGGYPDVRRAIVLVSEGFVRTRTRGNEALPDVTSVIRNANRFDVRILTVDPTDAGRPDSQAIASLQNLAHNTGGVSLTTTTDMVAALTRLRPHLDAPYELTYRPSHVDDGKFHAVQVRVKREGVLVQARSAYLSPVDEVARKARLAALALNAPTALGPRLALMEPAVLRVRTAREFAAVVADPNAAPVVARQFSRTERLLIRVPGGPQTFTDIHAKLLNSLGQVMRELPGSAGPDEGMTQFDLPLAPFAPGEYRIELTARTATGDTRQYLNIRITG